ncbi:MAG: thioredoxin family protein [Thermodesulfobacteriota bacterium]
MTLKEIKSIQDLAVVRKQGLALVDISAPWCAQCSLQEPIIRRIAEQFEGKACVAMINIDERNDVALQLGIHFIPTLILFRDNKEVQRFTGLQPEDIISEAIERFLS